jgi:hypothetical protein
MFLTLKTPPPDVDIQKYLTSLHIDQWLRDGLFHYKWWILILLVLVSLLIWWNRIDKSRLHEICLYAALAAIIAMGIFEWGEELTLWEFPIDIIPIFPPLSSINLIGLPLIYSLAYQHFRTWKGFLWAGLYQLLKWEYYYSFPVYAAMAVGTKAVADKIHHIEYFASGN